MIPTNDRDGEIAKTLKSYFNYIQMFNKIHKHSKNVSEREKK